MKLALGTVQFGLDYGISNSAGKTPLEEVSRILEFAYSKGIRILDTASSYGDSESVIGSYLRLNRDQDWRVISKFSRLDGKDNIGCQFDKIFNQSKRLLGESLDTFLAHDAKHFLADRAIQKKFWSLRETRLISKIGISVYTLPEINEAIDLGGLDVIQLPVNVLDHRLINSGLLARIKKSGIEIHARSVFLQGLFFLTDKDLRAKFPDVVETISKLKEIAHERGLELRDLALLFVQSIPEVDLEIIGVNNLDQLIANIDSFTKAYSGDITQHVLGRIDYRNENVLNPPRWIS